MYLLELIINKPKKPQAKSLEHKSSLCVNLASILIIPQNRAYDFQYFAEINASTSFLLLLFVPPALWRSFAGFQPNLIVFRFVEKRMPKHRK